MKRFFESFVIRKLCARSKMHNSIRAHKLPLNFAIRRPITEFLQPNRIRQFATFRNPNYSPFVNPVNNSNYRINHSGGGQHSSVTRIVTLAYSHKVYVQRFSLARNVRCFHTFFVSTILPVFDARAQHIFTFTSNVITTRIN